ncbi:hypothetical protein LN650_00445 [Klebsiella pneumoniae subsp. pneumoniae]|nr:hypothetical protein [Klebsiella pneumoniae subsp. pneumoniae]
MRARRARAMNTRLEGGCQVPIGSYAELKDGNCRLRALVGAPGWFTAGARRTTRASGTSGSPRASRWRKSFG